MSKAGLDDVIPAGARLVVDTSVLIAHMSGAEATSALATRIVDGFVAGGRNDGVLSSVTIGEALVRPSQVGEARNAGLAILDLEGMQVRSVDFLVGAEAARIRAATSLELPDAAIIATGVLTSAQVLVTNDRRLAAAVPAVVPEMQVVLLSDLV